MALTKQHFDDRMDEVLQKIAKLQQENKLLRSENRSLRSELLRVKSTALRSELYSRRNNLVIHGLESSDGEDLRQKVVGFFESKLGIATANEIRMNVVYRISKKPSNAESSGSSGPTLRNSAQRKNSADPIFASLENFDRSEIMKECGKLKKTGFSVSVDLPADLGKRRKELLSLGYKLRNSKVASEKIGKTRLIQKGIKLWLETKKSKTAQWMKFPDKCYDPLKLPRASSDDANDSNSDA